MIEQKNQTESAVVSPRAPVQKSIWPMVTVALMVVGYAGYYLCRSDLSVARPLIIDEFKGAGFTKETIGLITGWGTLLYALGKFVFGSATDQVGGRRMFLFGMGGAVVCTILFGLAGGFPMFMLAWCGNRAVQSSGWVGMVKITSRWFKHDVYGSVMGVISLSFLFGDFLSRLFLGRLINLHYGWREVFYVSAGVLALIFIPTLIFIRNSPIERNLPEPEDGPEAVFADAPQEARVPAITIVKRLFSQRTFWVVCALSFGFTLMRETFNDWTPTVLHEVAKMTEGDAGMASSLFPLFGAISVILVGFLSDRLKIGGRALMMAIGLAFGTVGILALAFGNLQSNPTVYVGLVAAIAFVLIGPYSLLAGAVSMDYGGKHASATAAGYIDGIGYIGGMLSGYGVGSIATRLGWQYAFVALAGVCFVSGLFALLYWKRELDRGRELGLAA